MTEQTNTEQEIKVICCNCYYGDLEEWKVLNVPGRFKCPNCNDSFIINDDGNIQEE